jgi:hypothetical protein
MYLAELPPPRHELYRIRSGWMYTSLLVILLARSCVGAGCVRILSATLQIFGTEFCPLAVWITCNLANYNLSAGIYCSKVLPDVYELARFVLAHSATRTYGKALDDDANEDGNVQRYNN